MKKTFSIYCRELEVFAITSATEKVSKCFFFGAKNEFFTILEAENFINDKENESHFTEGIDYFILPIFKKEEL